MHTHRKSFVSLSPPEEVLNRFRQLSAEKQWTVVSEDPARVYAQSGLTLRSAGEDLVVSVESEPRGTRVDLVVTPRLGKLQVIDWGEGSKFAREIAEWLGAREVPQA